MPAKLYFLQKASQHLLLGSLGQLSTLEYIAFSGIKGSFHLDLGNYHSCKWTKEAAHYKIFLDILL